MRIRSLFIAVCVAATVAAAPPAATVGDDLVDACTSQGGDDAMCRGIHALLRVVGGICRDASNDNNTCVLADGITINQALVAAHEASWLSKTMNHQRELDDHLPLVHETWAHTHNSYNADAYDPSFYGQDRNQIYTVRDQLRMGVRALELDIHWAFGSVVVCHGEVQSAGGTPVHFGCSPTDPTLADYLREIRAWVDSNGTEVILIYLENSLDGNAQAHGSAINTIENHIGDLVYAPALLGGSGCTPLPVELTREEIRKSGKRIVLAGNCGPGVWPSWVFERGSRWQERGIGYGNDSEFVYPCTEERARHSYDSNLIRRWGDETGLSAGAEVFGQGGGGDVTVADARNMVRCGVNLVGMDNLVPLDARMAQFAWSWAEAQPKHSEEGYCATHNTDGRFYSVDCEVIKKKVKVVKKGKKGKKRRVRRKVVEQFNAFPFACYDGSNWSVTTTQERHSKGDEICRAEGRGSFSVPWSAYENERLKDARPSGATHIWLDYKVTKKGWEA